MTRKRTCQLLLTTGMSNRAISDLVNTSHNTVGKYRATLREKGLSWKDVQPLGELDVISLLSAGSGRTKQYFIEPEWRLVHEELSNPLVTLSLLHGEYLEVTPTNYMSEREFRRRYGAFARTLGIVMRKPRQPGENMEVDFSGKRPRIYDKNGNAHPVELFVATVGSSTKSFAYATQTQSIPDFINANMLAIEYFGCCANALVSDNLKAAVDRVDKKDGHHINQSFQRFTDHYDITPLPTQPRCPKQKATVENAVRLMQRWVLAKIRNRVFHSIEELNAAIRLLNDEFNDLPMKKRGGKTRNALFVELDAPLMRALPSKRYEYADWKVGVRVPKDYHFLVDGNYYSVPCDQIGELIDIRVTKTSVEAYLRNRCIAVHPRSQNRDEVITNADHRPPNHKAFAEDQVSEALAWAEKSGAAILEFMIKHIATNPGAAAKNGIKGVKRHARDFGLERLDKACSRALLSGSISTQSLRSMLTRGLEDAPLPGDEPEVPVATHENVRGASHYENE